MWYFFERKEIHISSTKKLATGILLLTLGFYILSLGVKDLSPSEKVSMFWITGL
jgi:POT family proton-dependent oligopeptide transporter